MFLGARRKAQRLDFLSLPTMRCGHIHDPHEWSKSGSRYPTFEEAEYTPSLVFTIAVTVTAWATRMGLRVEAIPRLPPVCQSGDVRSLLQFDAIELRSHLMDITGLHLGGTLARTWLSGCQQLISLHRQSLCHRMLSTLARGTSPIDGNPANGHLPSRLGANALEQPM